MEQVKKVNPKHGTCAQLHRMFGLSKVSISKALNGKVNTDRARKVRQAALNLGGDPIY
jgi:hypothetical protein